MARFNLLDISIFLGLDDRQRYRGAMASARARAALCHRARETQRPACSLRADILETLDRVFARMIGSADPWARRKAKLKAGQRWVELVY